MSIVYTDPGLMDRQIDIYDQPSDQNSDGLRPDPVLFAAGIFASITGVDNTSESLRLKEQVLSKITHKVIIRYLPGIKSRMFIQYSDPDNGVRRFDIDRAVDPDEHKVELRILAIERNDGQ